MAGAQGPQATPTPGEGPPGPAHRKARSPRPPGRGRPEFAAARGAGPRLGAPPEPRSRVEGRERGEQRGTREGGRPSTPHPPAEEGTQSWYGTLPPAGDTIRAGGVGPRKRASRRGRWEWWSDRQMSGLGECEGLAAGDRLPAGLAAGLLLRARLRPSGAGPPAALRPPRPSGSMVPPDAALPASAKLLCLKLVFGFSTLDKCGAAGGARPFPRSLGPGPGPGAGVRARTPARARPAPEAAERRPGPPGAGPRAQAARLADVAARGRAGLRGGGGRRKRKAARSRRGPR
ncbi:collagen alpha-1(I) chain [Bubalus bubalis]|uniref:collagen alpha-1(I) chain n=1 Tax=Bubalus bubalis TaxID=89462 RepID=UPI001D105ABE|nr:collagen alpha-1(I) chain [Bubalus bubalis]